MRNSLKILTVATALFVGIATAPALYAHASENTEGGAASPTGQGNMPMNQENMPMNQNGMTGQGNMAMGQGGMMNMMNMMGQMSQMMETHSKFMSSMMEAHGIQQDDDAQ